MMKTAIRASSVSRTAIVTIFEIENGMLLLIVKQIPLFVPYSRVQERINHVGGEV